MSETAPGRPLLPAALLAAAAGAAGLAIELVWMRQLSLLFGSASLAAGLVVAALMFGMAAGSALAGRRGPRALGGSLLVLALLAVASAPILEGITRWGVASMFAAGLFVALGGVPMGMLVPLLVAWSGSAGTARRAGTLYAANTLGASLGVLATGFLALPALGNRWTLGAAAAACALLALPALKGGAPASTSSSGPLPARGILALYALSAFAAMAGEIGWMRALVLSVGSSTYANTIVLAVYIAGLGLGGALAARFLGRVATGRAFGVLQLAIAFACLGTLVLLGVLPGILAGLFRDRVSSLGSFAGTALLAAAAAILIPAALVGASFQAALAWLTARASGTLLAAATAGSTAGALAASFLLIPAIGLQATLAGALLLHAFLGSGVLTAATRRPWAGLAVALLLAGLFFRPPWDVRVTQSGPYMYGGQDSSARSGVLFARDDSVASVAVLVRPDGNRVLRIDGKTDASMARSDRVTQLLTAHIPLSLHANPQEVALVGLGSGMTLASCLAHDPRRVDVIEISPAVVRASRFFDASTGKPLDDPRTRLHTADARSVLGGTRDRFDVIINEPSNLWIAGMAGLFTREFYGTCRDRLNEGGLMAQWIHAYSIPADAFRDAIATFTSVFPHVTLWELWVSGDYLLVGSTKPLVIDADAVGRRLARPAVGADLEKIDVSSAAGLLADLVARGEDLAPALAGARIQTDDGLHLEFSAPLGFYGRHRLAALQLLPPVDAASLSKVVRGADVGWAESRRLLRAGIRATVEGRPLAETLPVFLDAVRKFPEDRHARFLLDDQAEACLAAADRALKAGDPAKVLAELEPVPVESALYPPAGIRKVAALRKQGAVPGRLIEEYRKILMSDPGHLGAGLELAELALQVGILSEADDVSARMVGKEPSSARVRVLRGKVLKKLGRIEEARAEWQAARRFDEKGPHGIEAVKLLQAP